MFEEVVTFIRETFKKPEGIIPLHEPRFIGNERKYVMDAIDSTFVSSVGKYVDRFEEMVQDYTGAKYAVATSNGTSALHIALLLAGVKSNELVICQPLTFIATCNAISYINAAPVFVDVSKKTLGLCSDKLAEFLKQETEAGKNGSRYHKKSGKRIAACVPMHSFGHPCEIDLIVNVCNQNNIPVVEDAAESLGSTFRGQQTGTFGLIGIYSFNGNKTITCGGGGAIVMNDEKLAKLAKHLTTQAKTPHKWEFNHDMVGYNYRLPNLNAAMACGQMEKLDEFIGDKRKLAELYKKFFAKGKIDFFAEPENAKSNYWLNAVLLKNREERDLFLTTMNGNDVMARPAWTLMNKLPMFNKCITGNIDIAIEIENRLVNIPSSAIKMG